MDYLAHLKIVARDLTPVANARVAACIVHKRRVIAYGVNQMKTHPLQKRFGKNRHSIYLHAEISAIHNAIRVMREVDFLRNSVLYVARVKIIDGEFVSGLACPCEGCQKAIAQFQIGDVIWTE